METVCSKIFSLNSSSFTFVFLDKHTKTLFYACRNCDYSQEADNPCVYINKLEQELIFLIIYISLSGPSGSEVCGRCSL
ncbi:unnamed protein product [Trichobilharzia regenti]|nr:unnamed protein product [Trichobilharzia regenti]